MTPELKICKTCNGSGEQRYMQSAVTGNGTSIRVGDLRKSCKKCGGYGYVMKINEEATK